MPSSARLAAAQCIYSYTLPVVWSASAMCDFALRAASSLASLTSYSLHWRKISWCHILSISFSLHPSTFSLQFDDRGVPRYRKTSAGTLALSSDQSARISCDWPFLCELYVLGREPRPNVYPLSSAPLLQHRAFAVLLLPYCDASLPECLATGRHARQIMLSSPICLSGGPYGLVAQPLL